MNQPRFSLDPNSLQTKVGAATFDRGLALYRNQQVLDYEIHHANSREWEIEGEVRGSERVPYWVTVTAEVEPDGRLSYFEADCSCPVGDSCKHAVALTLKAAYKSGGVIGSAAATAAAAKPALTPAELLLQKETLQRATAERERLQAQQNLSRWLDLFGPDPAAPDTPGSPARGLAQEPDQLVYMLIPATQGKQAVLQLGVGLSRPLRKGGWAKVKLLRYIATTTAPQDLEILRLIDAMAAQTYSYGYSNHQGVLTGQTGELALRLAAGTGRLFGIAGERVLGAPLKLGSTRSLAWRWEEATEPSSAEPLWALQPQLADAGAVLFGNTPPLYLDLGAGVCGAVESPGVAAQHLPLLLKAPPIPLSAFARHETTLLRRLAGLPLPPTIEPPHELRDVTPVAHLHIAPVAPHEVPQRGLLSARLQFDYAGQRHYAPGLQNPVLIELGETRRLLLHRDLPAEQAAQAQLHALGLVGDAHGHFHLPFASAALQQAWLLWADQDFAPLRAAGFVLTLDAGLADWITRADALEVALAPDRTATGNDDLVGGDDSGSAWFDLSLGVEIDGQRRNILPWLPELLAQIGVATGDGDGDGGRGTAQLPPFVFLKQPAGGYLRLPTEPLRPWLQALLELVGERGTEFGGDNLRLSRMEALRVGAALGEGAQWQGADILRQMVRQLAGHSALPEVAVPEGLQASLRPYQQQGLNWLQFLREHGLSGILADDMGLGKTLQTLAHILVEKQAGRLDKPALIVAPVSLMGNWLREAARFTPELRALVLHGQDRHEAAAEIANHDLVIAPYSLLQRDRERWLAQRWHLVVLDEAQNIKNASTGAAQVASELPGTHRLCLSGTPMENHLGELWSLFHFLMPGFLGSQARFKALFRTPIEKHGDGERLDQLRRRITPFMLRRTKNEVATELPDKVESIASVELTGKQADLYESIRLTTEKAVREALADKGLAKSQIQILDALLKLRQVCCDPRLVPLAAARNIKQSAKLELLMTLLPEMLAEGRRVLLFSQFTTMLELIEAELKARDIRWVKLTGQSQKRDRIIDRFTSGEVPLFLISLKAGGTGLNLPQADTVIHYDPWWNPAVEHQATDRAHRIGQKNRVFVYKLVAQGTIEERILALQERKAALAESMYSGSQARKQPLFTEGDVAELLRPLGG